ncbi:PEX26 [Bugula neritina]|uniref:PEX26 n=1 Tax=Bugula neritina TaxID=10212 RepID=A0A7J7KTA4_BUGNE|nr:PEX26 [Bugula neritina]
MAQTEIAKSESNIFTYKKSASVLLIARDFEKCLEVCKEVLRLRRLGNLEDKNGSTTENENLSLKLSQYEETEHLIVILIQAFAELERWEEVLPYITDYYQGIENVSAYVLKLCLLLHARVREYSICSAIYNIWMRANAQSWSDQEDISMLVDVYIKHVLIPTGKASEVEGFLRSTQLDEASQQKLLSAYEEVIQKSRALGSSVEDEEKEKKKVSQHNSQAFLDSTVGKAFRVVGVVIRWFRTIEPRRVAGILVSLAGLAAFAAILLNGVPVAIF